jgi:hypothetical protein
MELKENIAASHPTLTGDMTMLAKIALVATLIAGTATVAFAEDSSSSFPMNIYAGQLYYPTATQNKAPHLRNRNVSLGAQAAPRFPQAAAQDWFTTNIQDRASSPYAGGG